MKDQELLFLSKSSLFSGLKLSELKSIFQQLPHIVKSYEKNTIIKIRGDVYDSLILVLKGELDAEISDISGKTIKIESLKAPAVVASVILFASDPSIPVTIKTANETKLLILPKKTVIYLCQKSEIFLNNYLQDAGDKISFLAEKIRLFKFSSLRQKTAGYILDLASRYKCDNFTLPHTKEVIAEIFGVTRPSLSRIFSELSSEEIISQDGKVITIKNRSALIAMLNDNC